MYTWIQMSMSALKIEMIVLKYAQTLLEATLVHVALAIA
jgi:hypothetical protein